MCAYLAGWGFKIRVDGVEISAGDYALLKIKVLGDPLFVKSSWVYNPQKQILVFVANDDIRVDLEYKGMILKDYGLTVSNSWNGSDYTYIDFKTAGAGAGVGAGAGAGDKKDNKEDGGFWVLGALIGLYFFLKGKKWLK